MSRSSSIEPVAVIGLSCRLPQAPDPESFWQLLREGRDAITQAPADRWPEARTGYRRAGFLDSVDEFDAAFFGISPREATAMDPHQRLMLELSWQALEDAGIAPERLSAEDGGHRTGVFTGVITDDYAALTTQLGPAAVTPHTMTGLHRSIIANRVSYALGLRGPSLTVDTGQSSSLVSVHLACESLRAGESTVALAGGVNLNLIADTTERIGAFGALSPDGRCYTFDSRANGYVRGEGGGVIVLKLLSRAIADGDPVRAVLLGSAVNNDGGGTTLTAPSRQAQEQVLRLAHRQAGVDPADVQYVEMHGTGTPVGDPIEAAALGGAIGAARAARDGKQPLAVGSVKTNVGHLEGAAGITGLLKVLLSVQNRELPASLNFETPNPDIPLDELNLRVQRATGPWPETDRPLLAGVSAWGMGGTNCHVVVGEWTGETAPVPTAEPTARPEAPAPAVLPWPVSGSGRNGLRAQAGQLAAFVEERPELALPDLGYSLALTRAALDQRAVVLTTDRDSALSGLAALADGVPGANVVSGTADVRGPAAFVFPGQGAQWQGMGAGLLESSPVFAERMAECDAALRAYVDWSVTAVVRGDEDAAPLDDVVVVQCALWAMMVCLAAVWQEAGVEPAAVVGHSQGEIAAATVAGCPVPAGRRPRRRTAGQGHPRGPVRPRRHGLRRPARRRGTGPARTLGRADLPRLRQRPLVVRGLRRAGRPRRTAHRLRGGRRTGPAGQRRLRLPQRVRGGHPRAGHPGPGRHRTPPGAGAVLLGRDRRPHRRHLGPRRRVLVHQPPPDRPLRRHHPRAARGRLRLLRRVQRPPRPHRRPPGEPGARRPHLRRPRHPAPWRGRPRPCGSPRWPRASSAGCRSTGPRSSTVRAPGASPCPRTPSSAAASGSTPPASRRRQRPPARPPP